MWSHEATVWLHIFMNFSNASRIMKILTSKILVLYIGIVQLAMKFLPEQKATMLVVILHVPSATLANWPCRQ